MRLVTKPVFSGGRTNLSLALFHYDYSDFQLNQTIGIAVVTRNAGDTQVQGAEIELSSLLNENWSVSAAVTLLDTQYDDFTNVDGMKPELGFQNVEGNPLNKAPDTSINLGVSYTTAAPWGGRLALYGDAAYRSRTYFREFKEKEDSQGAYTIVSLNAIWESENRDWEARLFARNATDEEYRVSQGGGNAIGARTGTYGMPRQVGFEVTRRFGAM